MTNDAKITYGIVAIIIVFLSGMAYFLQPTDTPLTQDTNNNLIIKEVQKQPTSTSSSTKPMEQAITNPTTAVLTTNKGVIEFTFSSNTPVTVENFKKLAGSGYYNGVRFHRVIKDFMIQTGDPNSKDIGKQGEWGMGGPGYKFNDELTGSEQYSLGTVAMANSGPNTNGSQFFIVTANPGYPLPPNYTVFGRVTKGIETALAIQNVATAPSDRPLEDIIITKVELK
jgi:cyclophilin family peptidyl-prolyl cis-trans isomerase